MAQLSAYAKLAILTAVILFEPQWPQTPNCRRGSHLDQQNATRLIDRILHRCRLTRAASWHPATSVVLQLLCYRIHTASPGRR